MLKKILVALDGSDLAERVLQALEELQLHSEAKIILAHVIPPPESNLEIAADRPHPESPGVSFLQIEKQLQSYQAKLPVASEVEISTGDAAEEIIRLANIYKVDLVVIGSRGLTGVKRIVLGSVSSQVVEEAPCSVLVIKPN